MGQRILCRALKDFGLLTENCEQDTCQDSVYSTKSLAVHLKNHNNQRLSLFPVLDKLEFGALDLEI